MVLFYETSGIFVKKKKNIIFRYRRVNQHLQRFNSLVLQITNVLSSERITKFSPKHSISFELSGQRFRDFSRSFGK